MYTRLDDRALWYCLWMSSYNRYDVVVMVCSVQRYLYLLISKHHVNPDSAGSYLRNVECRPEIRHLWELYIHLLHNQHYSWGVVVLWRYLLVRTIYGLLLILGGGWCFPFPVKSVSYGTPLSLCLKIQPWVKSQSQLPLHMVLCWSCCRGNITPVPLFSTFTLVFGNCQGYSSLWKPIHHNNRLIGHNGKGEPTMPLSVSVRKIVCL